MKSNFISNGTGVAFYRCAIPNVGSWQVHNQMGNGPTRSIIPFADCMGLSQEIGCWHFKKDDQDPRQSNTRNERKSRISRYKLETDRIGSTFWPEQWNWSSGMERYLLARDPAAYKNCVERMARLRVYIDVAASRRFHFLGGSYPIYMCPVLIGLYCCQLNQIEEHVCCDLLINSRARLSLVSSADEI